MKVLSILWFIEHPEREMHICNRVVQILESEGIQLTIRKVLLNFIDLNYFGQTYNAVVIPGKNVLLSKILSSYSGTVICLNYEQMISELNKKLKAADEAMKIADTHLSWSPEFTNYLVNCGISPTKIVETLRPQTEIANAIISNQSVCTEIEELKSKKFAKIVYAPLTCLQAFKSHKELQRLSERSTVSMKELLQRKEAVINQLKLFYIQATNCNKNILYVVRPHPSISVLQHVQFCRENKIELKENVIITDKGNVYEYFSIADIIISNYSSVILDAIQLDKEAYIIFQTLLPDHMNYGWMKKLKNIENLSSLESFEEFKDSCESHVAFDAKANSLVLSELLIEANSEEKISYSSIFKVVFSKRFFMDFIRSCLILINVNNFGLKKDYVDFNKLS